MKIVSVEEMRNMDSTVINTFGISEELLMENAGLAACSVILAEYGVRGKKFVILCGIGNNGGDGFVVARKLHSMGGTVQVYILGDVKKYKGAAKMNYETALRLPVKINSLESLESIEDDLSDCDAVIDALFGTGLRRNVEGIYHDVIELINIRGKKVFSIDIPSGINGNTGKIMGVSIRADYTITYGTPKIGNVLYPGYEYSGKLYLSQISFPTPLFSDSALKIEINQPPPLPPRDPSAHKGDFGDALFIAGASNYYGAPYFSAFSFLKSGGGYSRLASPASVTPFIAARGSEIVFIPQVETSTGSIALKNKDRILELSELVDIVVIGPGLSLNEETQDLVRIIVQNTKKPLVIDGDGITAVAQNSDLLRKRSHPTVLTPHLGEMSKITGKPVLEIDRQKIKVLEEVTEKLDVFIVLKGAHSLIGYPDGRIYINMSGNSGMATAGSGDTLTGAIAAMFGLGLNFDEAVRTGVFIHGFSGDLAASDIGDDGITAQDILDYLPRAVKKYRENYPQIVENHYGTIYNV